MGIDSEPKSLNQLMRHLRDDHEISIVGSKHKKLLKHYGYYHGFKGYRFFKTRGNSIDYSDFDQVVAVVQYDNSLKSVFYSRLMFLETALKNIVIDEIVSGERSASFDAIYASKMSDQRENTRLKLARLRLKDRVHSSLSKSYSDKNSMISHYYDRGDEVPLWAIFEILSLGDFATFLRCLDENARKTIQANVGLSSSADSDEQLLSNIVYTIKSLRNAVAHNNIIFDARFKDRDANKNVLSWIYDETGINAITFEHITDYLILLCCMLKKIGCEIGSIQTFIDEYRKVIDTAYMSMPTNVYTKIISTDARRKIAKISEYVKRA